MYERVRSSVLDPLDGVNDDEGVALPSKHIKSNTMCLVLTSLAISIILIIICTTTGQDDLKWDVTVTWLVIIWTVVSLVTVGMFATHPIYRSRMVEWWKRMKDRCMRNKQSGGDNPLIMDPDTDISLEEQL